MGGKKYRIAIVGSGPAGWAAAVYTSRAEMEVTVYAGEEPGGQLTKTTEIENYPGVMGKTGPELMMGMQAQAEKFEAKLVYESVTSLRLTANGMQLKTENGEQEYNAVILAMGAAPKMLGIGEEKYYGKGFSTCAVCDAAFYRGKNVYVVGGGDTAIEDAWALTKFASSVTMLVRGDAFRASRAMQKRVNGNPDKIKVMWKTNLRSIGGERVEELVLDVDGKEEKVSAEGLFFAIGHTPATKWLVGSGVELDEAGYIRIGFLNLLNPKSQMTNDKLGTYPTMTKIPGVFAGGDCVDHRYRQAVVAAGQGVMCALDAERWMER